MFDAHPRWRQKKRNHSAVRYCDALEDHGTAVVGAGGLARMAAAAWEGYLSLQEALRQQEKDEH